ncbi:MAG: T9SS type A sorting domain-containing protein, partial [Bacteroidota bacterium]
NWIVTVSEVNDILGLDEETRWSIYPNPVENILHVQTKNSAHVTLIDIQGKRVIREVTGTDMTLELAGLNAGIYILRIVEGDHIHFRRIMKSRSN